MTLQLEKSSINRHIENFDNLVSYAVLLYQLYKTVILWNFLFLIDFSPMLMSQVKEAINYVEIGLTRLENDQK